MNFLSSPRSSLPNHPTCKFILWQPICYTDCLKPSFSWTYEAYWNWLSLGSWKAQYMFCETPTYHLCHASCWYFYQATHFFTILHFKVQSGNKKYLHPKLVLPYCISPLVFPFLFFATCLGNTFSYIFTFCNY